MTKKEVMLNGRMYTVDEAGNVYRANGKPLTKYFRRAGYQYVSARGKKCLVHRIVASAFLPNPLGLKEINHIDGDKTNNSVGNLEWITSSDNQTHSRYVLGNMTGFHDVAVRCKETGERFRSTRDAWRKTGVNYCHISECANGKRKTAGGFHWERMTV